jgi:hypothetical protein
MLFRYVTNLSGYNVKTFTAVKNLQYFRLHFYNNVSGCISKFSTSFVYILEAISNAMAVGYPEWELSLLCFGSRNIPVFCLGNQEQQPDSNYSKPPLIQINFGEHPD